MKEFMTPSGIRAKVRMRNLHAAVIGLGYVGLPLAVHLAKKGVLVTGVDVRHETVESLRKGNLTVHEPGLESELRKNAKRLVFIEDLKSAVGESHVILVTVGTPFNRRPILKDLVHASREIGEALSNESQKLVILRSTVPPGTTEETIRAILEKHSGLKAGNDFALAFAPERTVEGQALREQTELPEIVGGIDAKSTAVAAAFFESVGHKVVRVSSARVAEMAKLFDNVYRDVNIALANELAIICEMLGVDVIETIRACNTGPRTRILTPGAGVGGSCLNKDPYTLIYVSRRKGFNTQLLNSARRRNEGMPHHVIELTKSALRQIDKRIEGARVAVLGLAFKRDTDDMRHSVAIPVIKGLQRLHADVVAYDPIVARKKSRSAIGDVKVANSLQQALCKCDIAIILTDHREFKLTKSRFRHLMKKTSAIVDGRHVLEPDEVAKLGIVFRGVGRPQSSAVRDTR